MSQSSRSAADPNQSEGTGGEPSSASSGKQYAKRGKITIVACVPCRKRKTKCDGKRPRCSQCTARNSECNFDMSNDERKLTYLRSQSEQLQEKYDGLVALVHAFQNETEEIAQYLLRRIRNGEDPGAVAEVLRGGRLLFDAVRGEVSVDPSSPKRERDLKGIAVRTARHRLTEAESPGEQLLRRVSGATSLNQYNQLMNLLITSPIELCNEVLYRIRQQDEIVTILQEVGRGSLHSEASGQMSPPPMPGLESIASPWTSGNSQAGQGRMDVDEGWTSVTRDSELISHLIELYFTWQHVFFQNFPENLFRRDFERRDVQYCSRALVNAICASGCFLSNRQTLKQTRNNDQKLIQAFYDEALDDLNSRKASTIPDIAAMYLVSHVEGYWGNESSQWIFGGRSALMALDLSLHLGPHSGREMYEGQFSQESYEESYTRIQCFWGCFHNSQIHSLMLGRPPIISEDMVTIELPAINSQDDAATWHSYERNIPERPGARSSTFHFCASFSQIVNRMQRAFHSNRPMSGSRLRELAGQYGDWHRSLPQVLSIDHAPTPPHVLSLHMYYYAAILLLYRPFVHARPSTADQDPRTKCLESAIYISQIWQRHRDLFGFSGIWGFQVNCLLMASSVYAENLSEDHTIHWLREACTALQDMAALHSWTKQALHTLRGMMEASQVQLPQSVISILYRGAPQPPPTYQHPPHDQQQQQQQQPQPQPQPHQYQPSASAARQSLAQDVRQRPGPGMGGPQYITSQQQGAAGTLNTPPSGFGATGQYNPQDPSSYASSSSASGTSYPSRGSSGGQQLQQTSSGQQQQQQQRGQQQQESRGSGFTPPGWQEPFLRYMREYTSSSGNGSGNGNGNGNGGGNGGGNGSGSGNGSGGGSGSGSGSSGQGGG